MCIRDSIDPKKTLGASNEEFKNENELTKNSVTAGLGMDNNSWTNSYVNFYGPESSSTGKNHKFLTEFPRAKSYASIESIAQTFPELKDVNNNATASTITNLKEGRVFIMRSNNDDDIHKAIKYGVWTSTTKSNETLNNAFAEASAKNAPVLLVYSVVKSGQFLGVAQITSAYNAETFEYWWQGHKWIGKFNIKWLFIKDINYKKFESLRIRDGVPVTRAKDCTEISTETAQEMLSIFQSAPNEPNIFQAFEYMDIREDYIRYYKNNVIQYPVYSYYPPYVGGYYYDTRPQRYSNGYYGSNHGYYGGGRSSYSGYSNNNNNYYNNSNSNGSSKNNNGYTYVAKKTAANQVIVCA
eukprot:TRINITY_DN621_c0_g3_i1.p1 TRINITY_DN621_c0_g3~~TRINITY_DN621_c0_g3_i1.p1  ORF type:complete len:354 (-),score=120.11 TRINITY_DN621_c0_g3_i1:432-1493(-)